MRTTYDDGSCLGNFLKEAAAPQLPARVPNGPFNQFGSYGYFTGWITRWCLTLSMPMA